MVGLQTVWLAIAFFKGSVVCVACMDKYRVWNSLDLGVAVLVSATVVVVNVAVDTLEVVPTEGPAGQRS